VGGFNIMNKPLRGKRVLITRPFQQIETFCRLLRDKGAEPIPHPTIEISEHTDNSGWEQFEKLIDSGGWCIFTSEPGVKYFFKQLFLKGYDHRALGKFKFAVVGHGTSSILEKNGFIPDLIPGKAKVSALIDELITYENISDKNIVRICGNLSNNTIVGRCEEAGANIRSIQVYNNNVAHWEEHWFVNIMDNPPDFVTFTSGSTIKNFIEILGKERSDTILHSAKIASIGPVTSQKIRKLGFTVHIEAEESNVEGLVSAIIKNNQN